MANLDRDYLRQAFLIAIIILLGIVIFRELTPFVSGFLGAITLYVVLRPLMQYLTGKRKWPKGLAAVVLILSSVILVLAPIGAVIQLLYVRLAELQIDSNLVHSGMVAIVEKIRAITGVELISESTFGELKGVLGSAVQTILNTTYNLAINGAMLCFILFFMLTNSTQFDRKVRLLIPLKEEDTEKLIKETNKMIMSNAVGIPLAAVVQGTIAFIGYTIFGVPDALFWSIVTGFFSVVPVIGTAAIWVPMAVYLVASGDVFDGIGLLAFCLLIMVSSDNVIRLILQKKMANIHPIVTIFGVIVGVSLFGFLGIIFGPLLISIFILLIKIYRKEYSSEDDSLQASS